MLHGGSMSFRYCCAYLTKSIHSTYILACLSLPRRIRHLCTQDTWYVTHKYVGTRTHVHPHARECLLDPFAQPPPWFPPRGRWFSSQRFGILTKAFRSACKDWSAALLVPFSTQTGIVLRMYIEKHSSLLHPDLECMALARRSYT